MVSYTGRFPSARHSLGKPVAKTHQTSAVIIPPRKAWESIQKIRKKHDRQFRRWMPHINLLYPFKPRSDFNWAVEELTRVCSGFKPFEVSLSRFYQFRHGKKGLTLWLAPEPVEKVVSLQERIFEVFPECDDLNQFSSGFTPHLSVGQVSGREKSTRLLTDLQALWKPVRFTVSEINLIWRKDPPNDKFQVWDTTAPLGH